MISAGSWLAGQHDRVGHPRHRQVRERFAAAVAGRRDAHQTGIQPVLHVALEDAVVDQHGAPRRIALVVDVERAAPPVDRAVVDDGDALGRDALADAAGERARPLAVEIAFEAVADRLVQQDAGPAVPQHHGHRAGRRGARVQIEQRLADRLRRIGLEHRIGEIAVVEAAAAARVALLSPSAVLHDHRQRHPHEGAHVGRDHAVASRNEHRFVFARDRGHHLRHARIARSAPCARAAPAARPWLPPAAKRRGPQARRASARPRHGRARRPQTAPGARSRAWQPPPRSARQAICRRSTRKPASRRARHGCPRRDRWKTTPP